MFKKESKAKKVKVKKNKAPKQAKKVKEKKDAYKVHMIDDIIVRILQWRDRDTFWTKDKIFFFRQFAYLSAGGIGIVDSVKLIHQNTDNFAVKEISKNILHYLNEWKTLAYALNRMPDYFDEWDVNIIKAGEETWNLTRVLKSLADEYGYLNTVKNKYVWAMIYPLMLLIIAFGAIILLFVVALPKIFQIMDGFTGIEIPVLTRILKSMSDFLAGNWKPMGIGVILLGIFTSVFLSTSVWKKTFNNFLMSLPLIGKMTKYYYLVKRCRYMIVMLSSGMGYVQTFQLLRDILWIHSYQEMIEHVLIWLQKWERIFEALQHETHIIPTNVSAMIKVGEESANLEEALGNILSMYQEELDVLMNRLSKVIEPIMMIFIGAVVMVVAGWVFGLILTIMEGAGM